MYQANWKPWGIHTVMNMTYINDQQIFDMIEFYQKHIGTLGSTQFLFKNDTYCSGSASMDGPPFYCTVENGIASDEVKEFHSKRKWLPPDFASILFHELTHIWQCTTGMLKMEKKNLRKWNGELIEYHGIWCYDTEKYFALPWEEHANVIADKVYREWRQIHGKQEWL